jgi:hypothetical protein
MIRMCPPSTADPDALISTHGIHAHTGQHSADAGVEKVAMLAVVGAGRSRQGSACPTQQAQMAWVLNIQTQTHNLIKK